MLGLKRNAVSFQFSRVFPGLNGFDRQVETKIQKQTCPASFNVLKQADRNHILRPRIPALIRFSRMIKDRFTTEDVFPYLGRDEIVQGQQQAPLRFGRAGINRQTLCHSPCQGSVDEAIKV